MLIRNILLFLLVVSCSYVSCYNVEAHNLKGVISNVKPSVVGVGLYDALGEQTHKLLGTGFVFGDGSLVATNYHVVSQELDISKVQYHVVFSGDGSKPLVSKAEIVAVDSLRDLAILKLTKLMKPLTIASPDYVDDGTEILLTGFPIGSVLGLYPATHRGIVAAITPDAIPSTNARLLSSDLLRRIDNKFMVYQLDVTAYPGNSGSPVYDATTGEVLAVLNKVFVKESKEAVLEKPSGISYAIPVKHLIALAKKHDLSLQ